MNCGPPSTHIIGFTELVASQKIGALNEKQEEYLSDALSSSHHLLALINDILDLSKVEAGKLELSISDVDPAEIINNGFKMISEKAAAHHILLDMDITGLPHTVEADERKLKQILYNLLSNAVKFTPDGGRIFLSARVLTADRLAADTHRLMTSLGKMVQLPLGKKGG